MEEGNIIWCSALPHAHEGEGRLLPMPSKRGVRREAVVPIRLHLHSRLSFFCFLFLLIALGVDIDIDIDGDDDGDVSLFCCW